MLGQTHLYTPGTARNCADSGLASWLLAGIAGVALAGGCNGSSTTTADASVDGSALDAGKDAGPASGDVVSVWCFGAEGEDEVHSLAATPEGQVLIGGGFSGVVDLGVRTASSVGSRDAFVARADGATPPTWVDTFGAVGSTEAYAVAAGPGSEMLAAGSFRGSVDFATQVLTAVQDADIFIRKYSAEGSPTWARRAGGTLDDTPASLAVAPDGSVYVTGTFAGDAEFGDDVWLGGPANEANVFVAKYSSEGAHAWSREVGESGFPDPIERGNGIALDVAGNALATGTFGGSPDFGGTVVNTQGSSDVFIAKYDGNSGELMNVGGYGGDRTDVGSSIAVRPNGEIYVTGSFYLTASFGGSPLTSHPAAADVFVAHYSASREHRWSISLGGPGSNRGTSVAVDSAGYVAVVGVFQDVLTIDDIEHTSSGADDIFVVLLNADATPLWARSFGSSERDYGSSVLLTDDYVVVGGAIAGPTAISGTPCGSAGSRDGFVLALKR